MKKIEKKKNTKSNETMVKVKKKKKVKKVLKIILNIFLLLLLIGLIGGIIFAIYILSAKVIILFLSRKFEKLFYIKSGQKTCFPVLGLIHDAITKLFAECFGSFPHVMKNTRHLF